MKLVEYIDGEETIRAILHKIVPMLYVTDSVVNTVVVGIVSDLHSGRYKQILIENLTYVAKIKEKEMQIL